MKKLLSFFLIGLMLCFALTGCSDKPKLDPDNPVTLTMWHVYGEQADSPMNRLIDEFNKTVGAEKGIIINVTLMSNASQIGQKLLDAQNEVPGVPSMPDLFFCHSSNAEELGVANLLNWNDLFTEDELNSYVPEFLEDGKIGDVLAVFPVSKSTHVLYVAGVQFDRFAKDANVSYDDLSTWNGFFSVAEKYYTWSGGKPFCALDYPIRCVELNALSKGAENFYTEDGWYDFDNPVFKESWMEFAQAISKGHIVVSDLYSNTMVMTGEVIAGIGSSASILYYNDVITYPDNTTEPMNLQVVPLPKTKDADLLVTLAGVGLCSYKTTEQKAEAAAEFARYITEEARNFEFAASTGYMPVNKGSFEKIKDYAFESKAYENLYTTLFEVNETATAIKEPSFAGYYEKIYALYDGLRELQPRLAERFANGEDAAKLAEETWDLFRSIE